jgi:hypothetical protein
MLNAQKNKNWDIRGLTKREWSNIHKREKKRKAKKWKNPNHPKSIYRKIAQKLYIAKSPNFATRENQVVFFAFGPDVGGCNYFF